MISGVRVRNWRAMTLRSHRACAQVHMLASGVSAVHTLQDSVSTRVGTAGTGLTVPSENTPSVCTHDTAIVSPFREVGLTVDFRPASQRDSLNSPGLKPYE